MRVIIRSATIGSLKMDQKGKARLEEERRVLADALAGLDFDLAILAEHGKDDSKGNYEPLFCPRIVLQRGGQLLQWPQRWQSLLPDMDAWARSEWPWLDDLNELAQPTDEGSTIRRYPGVSVLLDLGIQSVSAMPIMDGKRIIASIVVGNKVARAFNAKTNRRLKDGRAEAVGRTILAALHERREALVREMRQYFNKEVLPEALAKQLVERLGSALDWEFVAIWSVDRQFVLIAKCDRSEQGVFRIEQHTQDLSVGMLAYTLDAEDALRIDDVTREPLPYDYKRLAGLPACSTLFYPIRVGRRIEWILECASTALAAFRGPDREVLDRLIERLQSTLDLWFEYRLSMSMIDGIAQCILVLDRDGVIQRANRAAENAFGRIKGQTPASLTFDTESREKLDPIGPMEAVPVRFKTYAERPRPMLTTARMSGDRAFGRWVLHLSDPDEQRVLAGLRYAKATVEEVAAHARGPLMLARALVSKASREIRQNAPRAAIEHELDRAAESLGKADISYERLARALGGKEQTTLRLLLDMVRARSSDGEGAPVDVAPAAADTALHGNLASAAEALLSVVRAVAGTGPVRVTNQIHADHITIGLEDLDPDRIEAAVSDPFEAVESVARHTARGTGNVHTAMAAQGWRIACSEGGLEVRIPRSTAPGDAHV